jgi:hypothetical protein
MLLLLGTFAMSILPVGSFVSYFGGYDFDYRYLLHGAASLAPLLAVPWLLAERIESPPLRRLLKLGLAVLILSGMAAAFPTHLDHIRHPRQPQYPHHLVNLDAALVNTLPFAIAALAVALTRVLGVSQAEPGRTEPGAGPQG